MATIMNGIFRVEYKYNAPVPEDPIENIPGKAESVLIEKVELPDKTNIRGLLTYTALKNLETVCIEHARFCLSQYDPYIEKKIKDLLTTVNIHIGMNCECSLAEK